MQHIERQEQPKGATAQTPGGEGFTHRNTKDYLINFDNKRNKLKPSHPVHKSIEVYPMIKPGFKELCDNDQSRDTSKGRFSKDGRNPTTSTQVSGNFQHIFDKNPEQLERVELAQEIYGTHKRMNSSRPNFNQNPQYQTLDAYVTNQSHPASGVHPGTNGQFNAPHPQMPRTNSRNVSSSNMHKKKTIDIQRQNISPSRPMRKSNHFTQKQTRNTSKSHQRVNVRNPGEVHMSGVQPRNQVGQNLSGLSGMGDSGKGAFTGRYQTIAHPDPTQGSKANYSESQSISENLTQSHARFKQFEENLKQNPMKNLNKLMNLNNQQHTQKNIVNQEVLMQRNNSKQLRKKPKNLQFKKKPHQMGKLTHFDQLKQRSKNMSDRFRNPNSKMRSARNAQYLSKKNEFMKNARPARNTMKTPSSGYFLPNNNLTAMTNRPAHKTVTGKMPHPKQSVGNYSKRTYSKQVSAMHKTMSKHKSVSNLHHSSRKHVGMNLGSSKNLRGSQIIRTENYKFDS